MFHQIGSRRGEHGTTSGVVPRLLDCHERIRRHCEIAARLGGPEDAPPADVAAAAAQCLSYFERALPHHSADEEGSIAPRLGDVAGLAEPLADMTAQHRDIDALVEALVPLWRELCDAPGRRDRLRPALAEHAARLAAAFDTHLALEEQTIFPHIDALPRAVQDEIVAEMTARRDL